MILTAPITLNPEKSLLWDSDLVGISQQAFSGLIIISDVDIIGILSGSVHTCMYTVVQHYLLATECDCIAVGLLFESPSMCKIDGDIMADFGLLFYALVVYVNVLFSAVTYQNE